MPLSLINIALFSFLTLTPTVFSSALRHARQASLDLPLSLCALNLESTNDHTIDASCAGPFGGADVQVVNSKLSLDKCLTNSFGQLNFLNFGGFSNSCNGCELDGSTLDFSCTCNDGLGDTSSVFSIINLVLTTPDGAGIFLKDDGNIACRVPTA